MTDWMYCEVGGIKFRKSKSPDSDVVSMLLKNKYTNAFADLNIKDDEEKFRIACESYLRRVENGLKKPSKSNAQSDVAAVEGENIDV
jgi:hypothetical protein